MTRKVIMEIPDEKPMKFYADLVLEALQKHKSNGLSNWEITEMTGVPVRRVREETQKLKQNNSLLEKSCRCNRTPIYYLK